VTDGLAKLCSSPHIAVAEEELGTGQSFPTVCLLGCLWQESAVVALFLCAFDSERVSQNVMREPGFLEYFGPVDVCVYYKFEVRVAYLGSQAKVGVTKLSRRLINPS
jgi:hypothetical protein